MFDFEKLQVYQKSKNYHSELAALATNKTFDKILSNQLKRAALSIPLNIAEGTGRYTLADRRNFYVIARGSVFECAAIIDLLQTQKNITSEQKEYFYNLSEELSKMLYSMIQRLKN